MLCCKVIYIETPDEPDTENKNDQVVNHTIQTNSDKTMARVRAAKMMNNKGVTNKTNASTADKSKDKTIVQKNSTTNTSAASVNPKVSANAMSANVTNVQASKTPVTATKSGKAKSNR